MRRRDLEIALQRIPGPPDPDPALEQVPTPPDLAADVLFQAHAMGDIADRRVLDLGCGTGRLAIGAALLGARDVLGVDVDPASLENARDAATELGAAVRFEEAEVRGYRAEADTVLQNPPFGAQQRGADRPFLETALRCAPVVWSFHLAETRGFVERFVAERGARVGHAWSVRFPVPRLFRHHEEAQWEVDVALLRIVRDDASRERKEGKAGR